MERGKFQNNGYGVHLVILLLALTRSIIHSPCFWALLCAREVWSVGMASIGPPCCLISGRLGHWSHRHVGEGREARVFLPHFLSTLLPSFYQELHLALTGTPVCRGSLLCGSSSHLAVVNLSDPFAPSGSSPWTLQFNLSKNFSLNLFRWIIIVEFCFLLGPWLM